MCKTSLKKDAESAERNSYSALSTIKEYRIKVASNSKYLTVRPNRSNGNMEYFADQQEKMKADTFWIVENKDKTVSIVTVFHGNGLATYLAPIQSLKTYAKPTPMNWALSTLFEMTLRNPSSAVKFRLEPLKGDNPTEIRRVALHSTTSGMMLTGWPDGQMSAVGVGAGGNGLPTEWDTFILEPVELGFKVGDFTLRVWGGRTLEQVELWRNDDCRSYIFRLMCAPAFILVPSGTDKLLSIIKYGGDFTQNLKFVLVPEMVNGNKFGEKAGAFFLRSIVFNKFIGWEGLQEKIDKAVLFELLPLFG